jgi:hypothetical protein
MLSKILFWSSRVKPNKAKQIPFKIWHILKGDNVIMLNGTDRGKTG